MTQKRTSSPRPSGTGMERFNQLRPVTNVVYSLIFVLLAFICVVPVVFVIIISFSSEASISRIGYSFRPLEWSLGAYQYVCGMRDSSGIVSDRG